MLISYVTADPSGNLTGLVQSPVEASLRPGAAAALLRACPAMEQMGFISGCSDADIRLDMSGGEFCGNASLSAAALHLHSLGRDSGCVKVSVSGAGEPIEVRLKKTAMDEYRGSLAMPNPKSIGLRQLPGGLELPCVDFPGISHLILDSGFSRARAADSIAQWCDFLGAEALGLMLFDRKAMSLCPLVWVPGSATLFWENSCASGSAAVGAWLRQQEGREQDILLAQPGGQIGIRALLSGEIYMSGSVKLSDAKTLEII